MLDHNTTGDGLVTGLSPAAIVKATGQKLSDLAGIMRELPQVLVNVKVNNETKNIYETDEEVIFEDQTDGGALDGKSRVPIRASGTTSCFESCWKVKLMPWPMNWRI